VKFQCLAVSLMGGLRRLSGLWLPCPGEINGGNGEKQKVDVCRRHREPVEGYLRIMALGNAAVHQDGGAAAADAVVRLKLDQAAGAGDAGFSCLNRRGGLFFWDYFSQISRWGLAARSFSKASNSDRVRTRCRILRLM
jgi:hypothetical protein